MTDEEMKEMAIRSFRSHDLTYKVTHDESTYIDAFIEGFQAGRPKWHRLFQCIPYCEYFDYPQDTLPKVENFYFVRLKNGYIKVCELKSESLNGRKYFYDLHGCRQSNIVEWLDYPMAQGE